MMTQDTVIKRRNRWQTDEEYKSGCFFCIYRLSNAITNWQKSCLGGTAFTTGRLNREVVLIIITIYIQNKMKFHSAEITVPILSTKLNYFTKKGRQINSTNKFKLTVPLIKTSQTLIYKML